MTQYLPIGLLTTIEDLLVYTGVTEEQFEVCSSIVGPLDAAAALNIVKHGVGYKFAGLLYHTYLHGALQSNFGRYVRGSFRAFSLIDTLACIPL